MHDMSEDCIINNFIQKAINRTLDVRKKEDNLGASPKVTDM